MAAQYIPVARQEQLVHSRIINMVTLRPDAPRGNITWYALVGVPGLGILFTVVVVNKYRWSLGSSVLKETSA